MVTFAINDKNILSRYSESYVVDKIENFFATEFSIDKWLVLYGFDLEKENYLKTKSLKDSDFIDY